MFCPNRECPDFRALGAPGEYREGIEVCPKCGARLVWEAPAGTEAGSLGGDAAEDSSPETGPFVVVASFERDHDAHLAASMLLANGVNAVVVGNRYYGTDPRDVIGFAWRVMAPEAQADLARSLLERSEGRDESGGA